MRVLTCLLVLGLAVPGAARPRRSSADAEGATYAAVANALRVKVIVFTKRAPMRFASASHWVRFMNANRKQHLWPEKNNKKEWRFEWMAFWAQPLNDLEVTVKFYDITDPVKKLIAGDSFYLEKKGQRIYASNMMLNRPRFEVNRKYEMRVLSRQRVLASTTFWLRGEKERYSGKVTFTDQEASQKDE
jgi:hypothetical protein